MIHHTTKYPGLKSRSVKDFSPYVLFGGKYVSTAGASGINICLSHRFIHSSEKASGLFSLSRMRC